ncbi:MAG: helix-hairpin-helix domain-containing protein, partial [Planctomycetota bacterium]|nr:helix-hairpin-helix domain-containing protein [Planctomycetota bacterium]
MGLNADIVDAFEEMAILLEITGANGFKVNAHAKVARVVEGLGRELDDIARGPDASNQLAAIDGVGASSVKKIVELATTGSIADLETLRAEVPPG